MERRGTGEDHRRFSPLARMTREDEGRRAAPGWREAREGPYGSRWVEGNGLAPLGWEPWDYEQEKGYRRVHVGPYEYTWSDNSPYVQWDFDEVGVHPHDFTDEMEDWDLSPMGRRRYANEYRESSLEPDPRPLPHLTQDDLKHLAKDPIAKAYHDNRVEEARRQRLEDEAVERVNTVADEKRNLRAMRKAAREAMKAKVASGFEGRAEVHVRKGNQTLRWTYRVEDGKAFVERKVQGWVPLSQRR